jgi:SagB-type dehydrogenase family enzyme
MNAPYAPWRRARSAAAAAVVGLYAVAASAQDVVLPPPQTEGGKPLMQALKERRTTRSLADRPLPPQLLSNLLWAAFGVNRPDGHRTAPSARNWQEIDVYAVMADGAYLYDAGAHVLKRVLAQDIRAQAGTQSHARSAAVTLIYVADERRMSGATEQSRAEFAGTDTGFIAQNVYLYCASEGLGSVVFASIDRERLARTLKLDPSQRITLAQSVGYPAR